MLLPHGCERDPHVAAACGVGGGTSRCRRVPDPRWVPQEAHTETQNEVQEVSSGQGPEIDTRGSSEGGRMEKPDGNALTRSRPIPGSSMAKAALRAVPSCPEGPGLSTPVWTDHHCVQAVLEEGAWHGLNGVPPKETVKS